MRQWNDHDMGGWGFGLMAISVLLVLGLLVVLAVALTRYLGHPPQQRPPDRPATPPPSPEQLLAERFARGEIDAGEYRHRLDTLRGGPAGPAAG
ncbi:SHOCT domain-containing protein [Kitasatospora sp. NPDC057223]|uniref:SHOCT domain-containing protein n=1 Tax=Kitasatospora sp. NPDC057223 TaxID=3346055 RepID=UPI0036387B62